MLDWLYALFPTSNVSKHVVVQMNITKSCSCDLLVKNCLLLVSPGTAVVPRAQLFEGQLALTQVSFSFVQKHFPDNQIIFFPDNPIIKL